MQEGSGLQGGGRFHGMQGGRFHGVQGGGGSQGGIVQFNNAGFNGSVRRNSGMSSIYCLLK